MNRITFFFRQRREALGIMQGRMYIRYTGRLSHRSKARLSLNICMIASPKPCFPVILHDAAFDARGLIQKRAQTGFLVYLRGENMTGKYSNQFHSVPLVDMERRRCIMLKLKADMRMGSFGL